MRRSFALALTALLLVFTLTACGNRANDSTQSPSATQNETTDSTQSGTGSLGNESGTSGSAANDSAGSHSDQNATVGDEIGGAAGDLMNGMENAVDDILPDGNANTRQRGTGGVPYGDMMHNDRR